MKYTPPNIRMWSRLGPSGALAVSAMELGGTKENVVFVSADMAFSAGLERFKRKYPGRFFETGIAEQNLIGFSTGMASEGFLPFAVTYSTFLACRALDQIKMCLGYMKHNVKLIGLNAGLAVGAFGPTHLAVEDIAVIRAIPNIVLLSPADTTEMVKAIIASADLNNPVFIRLTGEMNTPLVYENDYEYSIGQAITLRYGEDVGIIATGAMVYNALQAADILKQKKINCTVVNMHTIKPLDTEAIYAMEDKKIIVTVEEHSIIGGLGSAVAELLAEAHRRSPLLLRLGVKDVYPQASSYRTLLEQCKLDAKGIASAILDTLSTTEKLMDN